MATGAAVNEFQRVWGDPQGLTARQHYESAATLYRYRWHLYQNTIFDDQAVWSAYRRKYNLYRFTRPIYNPVRRLVDFYAGIIYPGVLSADGNRLPDGTPLAIPLADDIDPALKAAIGQLWQWSNWQTGKGLLVRYGAALGDVLVEVVDEVDKGKVTLDIVYPGLVADLKLDSTGNVKAYAIEYDAEGSDGKFYTYRKEVDGDWIRELKDGELYQYDENIPAEYQNPYGFAPAVWVKHTDVGGTHGDPAIRNLGKMDELNELASHAHDRAHSVLSSPILVSGENVSSLTDAVVESKRGATQDLASGSGARESVKILKATNGSMSTVQLPEGEALKYMDKLLAELESDHPELNMYDQLRSMSQVTGPAAERLVGDAAAYIHDARANYDTQTVKLFQMAVGIAGWCAKSGAWGRNMTRQQTPFTAFDLASYTRGDLDFEIMPRPIVPSTGKNADDKRVAMEAGDRGYASWEWVSNEVTGTAEQQREQIDNAAAAQPAPEPTQTPQTVDALAQALARGGV
jgi:hypothetical protein